MDLESLQLALTAADEVPDAMGWTPREQRALEDALRRHPPTTEPRARWQAVAATVGSKGVRQCVQRCRSVAAAIRASLPPLLLRLQPDLLLSILEWLDGCDLCAVACACQELRGAAHHDVLWLPIANAVPEKWAYRHVHREGEPPWACALRVRYGLYGSWKMLTEHRSGKCP